MVCPDFVDQAAPDRSPVGSVYRRADSLVTAVRAFRRNLEEAILNQPVERQILRYSGANPVNLDRNEVKACEGPEQYGARNRGDQYLDQRYPDSIVDSPSETAPLERFLECRILQNGAPARVVGA